MRELFRLMRQLFLFWLSNHFQLIRKIVTITILVALVISVTLLIYLGYRFNWYWTGFNGNNKSGKTLWDWLQLLIIPEVLAVAGYVINLTISRGEQNTTIQRDKTEHDIAENNQCEAALQAYIDRMSELLLDKKLRNSTEEDEVRKIARVRTLTILKRLDGMRKGSVLQFLHESGLIDKDKCIIHLRGANLNRAHLYEADLSRDDLSGVNLAVADLRKAKLDGADLSRAFLLRVDLSGADLSEAKLSDARSDDAKLRRVNLSRADLSNVYLDGADLS